MSKWTIWFLISAIMTFITLGVKSYSLMSFEINDSLIKKATLDGIIVSKLSPLKIDEKKLKNVTATTSLAEFFKKNGGDLGTAKPPVNSATSTGTTTPATPVTPINTQTSTGANTNTINN